MTTNHVECHIPPPRPNSPVKSNQSCIKFHTFIDISSLNVLDFFRSSPVSYSLGYKEKMFQTYQKQTVTFNVLPPRSVVFYSSVILLAIRQTNQHMDRSGNIISLVEVEHYSKNSKSKPVAEMSCFCTFESEIISICSWTTSYKNI